MDDVLEHTRIVMLPMMNPDGFAAGVRGNSAGVNLNEDFPYVFTRRLNHEPQPETQAFMSWSDAQPPVMGASLHDGQPVVVSYPFDSTRSGTELQQETETEDDALLRSLAATYASHTQGMARSSDFTGGIINGAQWSPLLGSMGDWCYDRFGSLELSLELSVQSCPPVDEAARLWAANRAALLAFLRRSLQGVSGVVHDADGRAVQATIMPLSFSGRPRTTDSDGRFYQVVMPDVELTLVAIPDDAALPNKTFTVRVPRGANHPLHLTVTLPPAEARLSVGAIVAIVVACVFVVVLAAWLLLQRHRRAKDIDMDSTSHSPHALRVYVEGSPKTHSTRAVSRTRSSGPTVTISDGSGRRRRPPKRAASARSRRGRRGRRDGRRNSGESAVSRQLSRRGARNRGPSPRSLDMLDASLRARLTDGPPSARRPQTRRAGTPRVPAGLRAPHLKPKRQVKPGDDIEMGGDGGAAGAGASGASASSDIDEFFDPLGSVRSVKSSTGFFDGMSTAARQMLRVDSVGDMVVQMTDLSMLSGDEIRDSLGAVRELHTAPVRPLLPDTEMIDVWDEAALLPPPLPPRSSSSADEGDGSVELSAVRRPLGGATSSASSWRPRRGSREVLLAAGDV
eukprot:PLAT233.2.p1 GENE.PLAT233.2~~PLAT233.2.p1  ORF type:complete len:732 (-),score=326.57 PLAT233.2:43-1914(-)